jgi:class 3 adenylate cyclase/tetratricopeptide (TPR) repeat protein
MTVAPAEEERKVVSALFCDLVGFTEWSEQHDPEEVGLLLSAYYEAVRRQLVRFGGTVDKFIGDAVFGLFGAPRAHEDDPERAVRGALAVLEAVADLRERRPDASLDVRIGITTGEALVHVVSPDESRGMAWGDVINTASRLQSAAPPGEILVDEATHRVTRHLIAYEEAASIRAKGKAQVVAAWRALGPLARRGLDPALTDDGSSRFVGRGPELGQLVDALAAIESRPPHLVTIVGEPGIGKSCLVVQLFRHVDAGPKLIHWRHGRSPPYPEQISFWALGEIVKAQAGMLETDDAEIAAGKLERAVRNLVPDAARARQIEGQLRSLVGLAPAEPAGHGERGAAFAGWRQFLEALARQRPLILVFEDVHWADDGLLDFIEDLVVWSEHVPLLIVCTARPELLARRSDWGGGDAATTIVLGALSDGETRELIGLHTEPTTLRAGTTEAIVANAAGNPFFSVEFVRMVSDRAIAATPAAELPLPDSLRGLVAARLDALPPDEKRLLQAASVVGRAVWPGALSRIVGHPRRWCVEHLEKLERRQFVVRARRSSVGDEPEYRFNHALTRGVAYAQMPRPRRGEMHRRTAEWLELLSPDRAADRAQMLAHHYRCAYELARATGGETERLAERARRALRDAGDRALALHAFPNAAEAFRAALRLWPADDPERPSLLLRLGKSVYYAETGGGEILVEARDALVEAGDVGAAAEAEAFLASLGHHAGRHDLVFGHFERAVALVAGLEPTHAKADVLVEYANYQEVAGERELAIGAATEALEIGRTLGLRELEARALSIIGMAKAQSGHPGEGRALLRRSIEISEDIGSHLSADGCGRLADLEAQFGDLEACFELQERARRHAARFSHGPFLAWLAGERVGQAYWQGDWDEAVANADRLIADVEAGTPNFMEGYCRAIRGRMRLARGDVPGALDDATRALDFARAAEDPQMLDPALAFAAHAEVVIGSPDAGVGHAAELLASWRSRPGTHPVSAWVVDLAYALHAAGRSEELLAPAAAASVRTRWLDAVAAFAAGDFDAAADLFAAIGSRPDEAFARLRAGAVRCGRDAHVRLDAAARFYARVGATRHLDEITTLRGASLVSDRHGS